VFIFCHFSSFIKYKAVPGEALPGYSVFTIVLLPIFLKLNAILGYR